MVKIVINKIYVFVCDSISLFKNSSNMDYSSKVFIYTVICSGNVTPKVLGILFIEIEEFFTKH